MVQETRPKTAEEYVRLVEHAISELNDLRSCIDFDEFDEQGGAQFVLDPLEQALVKLRESMADGSYYFENQDLAFMPLVNRYRRAIPFARVLALINETHRKGLDIGEG